MALPDGLGLDDWIARNQFESRDALLHAMRDFVTAAPPSANGAKPKGEHRHVDGSNLLSQHMLAEAFAKRFADEYAFDPDGDTWRLWVSMGGVRSPTPSTSWGTSPATL